GIFNGGTMTVSDSTIAHNSAGLFGGGIDNGSGSGGVHGLTIINSTIAGNSAQNGGGIETFTFLGVTDSTIADNNVGIDGSGGGLDVDLYAGSTFVDNTIVALNTSGAGSTALPSDIAGHVSSSSAYDLIGTGGAGGLTDGFNGNRVGVADPRLGALADNGGP